MMLFLNAPGPLDTSAALLKFSRLTLGGRLGFAGAGPRARLFCRGALRLGPEVPSLFATPVRRLEFGGLLKLGFLLAGGFGGGVLPASAFTSPSGCSALLKRF